MCGFPQGLHKYPLGSLLGGSEGWGEVFVSFWEILSLGRSWGPDWVLWPRRTGFGAWRAEQPGGGGQSYWRCAERHPGPLERAPIVLWLWG